MRIKARARTGKSAGVDRRAVLAGVAALAGCAPRRIPYTEAESAQATVPGYGFIRIPVDAPPGEVRKNLTRLLPTGRSRPHWLALSGGGAGGAFGAAYLLGWGARGDRPAFDLVTGVSAGALIAPFAFLGKAGDKGLEEIFQPASVRSLQPTPDPLRAVFGPGLFGPGKLYDLVASYAQADIIAAVAERHRAGARLMVQTTDLDSGRGYVWDLGAIAASGVAGHEEMFRRVLTASASVPAVFPAQRIPVTAGGRRFEELHADGAVTSAILTIPDWALIGADTDIPGWRPRITVILDLSLDPRFRLTADRGLSVADRASTILDRNATLEKVIETYVFARDHKLRLRVASIHGDLGYDPNHPFADAYIRAARELGRKDGRNGVWDRRFSTG